MQKLPEGYPTQYGNILTLQSQSAKQRGSGQFNPPPLFQQSTDRGPSYAQALNFYENNYAMFNKPPQNETDPINNQYHVGSTGFHTESQGWARDLSIPEDNSDQYTSWAMKSVHQTPNVLLNFFFSKENVKYLLDRIVQEVKRIKGVDISQQSQDELLIIMRNHYQRALSGWLPISENPQQQKLAYPRGEKPCSLTSMLTRLNKSVLEECVKQVLSGVDMYKTYYKDASSLPIPLDRPTYMSAKGSRILSENVGFDSGHEFTRSVQSYNQRYNII